MVDINERLDRAARVLLDRGALVTPGVRPLAQAVLSSPRDRFNSYLLKAAADRLTWLERQGELELHPDEDALCALVDASYAVVSRG